MSRLGAKRDALMSLPHPGMGQPTLRWDLDMSLMYFSMASFSNVCPQSELLGMRRGTCLVPFASFRLPFDGMLEERLCEGAFDNDLLRDHHQAFLLLIAHQFTRILHRLAEVSDSVVRGRVCSHLNTAL